MWAGAVTLVATVLSGEAIWAVGMITGVGFLTVFTGAVVSLFVSKLNRALDRRETEQFADTLASIAARLDRIERALDQAIGRAGDARIRRAP